MLYKKVVPKNFSTSSGKHKKQSTGGVLSKGVLNNFAKCLEKTFFSESTLSIKLKTGNVQLSEAAPGCAL